MDPARMLAESLTSRPELENNQGHWLHTVSSELHPVLAVRRAHALAFLGRDEEAHDLYRRCRGQLVERGLTVEQLIASDCAYYRVIGPTETGSGRGPHA